jgi:carbonic anhydrase
MQDINDLIEGFKRFRSNYFEKRAAFYKELAQKGQKPRFLVVACSDSRVDPAILLNAEPGDFFTVRNVANLVPPYKPSSDFHGTSAALEFGVCGLGVRHIIVLGHSGCGGINALRAHAAGKPLGLEFMAPWMSIMSDIAENPHHAKLCRHDDDVDDNAPYERAAIRRSLSNLRTFPWIREREEAGTLSLHGWWFNLHEGALLHFDPESDSYKVLAS